MPLADRFFDLAQAHLATLRRDAATEVAAAATFTADRVAAGGRLHHFDTGHTAREPVRREGRPRHVAAKALDSVPVGRVHPLPTVDREARVGPREQLLVTALAQALGPAQCREQQAAERFLEHQGGRPRDRAEGPLVREHPLGDDRMDVRMEVRVRAECLDGHDHPGNHPRLSRRGGQHPAQSLVRRAREQAQEHRTERFAWQEGHRLRVRQEKARRCSSWHVGQRIRAKPPKSRPHSRSRSTLRGTTRRNGPWRSSKRSSCAMT